MMRADQLTQKGEGKVVAVIDTGVEMTHPAFAGAMGSERPRSPPTRLQALAPKLGNGKLGVYVSEKFPFAYDYADGDNDAMPAKGSYGSHGTHVAGITAGNADQIIGVAPEAQIIVAKVSRSEDGEIPDSALLAALDDMVVLRPDVVNLSLGQLGGMDNEADSVFASVFKKLQDEGISVNAAAGNDYLGRVRQHLRSVTCPTPRIPTPRPSANPPPTRRSSPSPRLTTFCPTTPSPPPERTSHTSVRAARMARRSPKSPSWPPGPTSTLTPDTRRRKTPQPSPPSTPMAWLASLPWSRAAS